MTNLSSDLQQKFGRVRLLAVDVDGVLTDGGVYILDDGREFRRFDIKDGLGLKQVMAAGIHVALISSATAEPVRYRVARLGLEEVHLGVADKLAKLREICERLGLALDQVCFMGDDLADLAVMQQVAVPCAPADAAAAVRQVAIWVTAAVGGHGAVREICDLLVETIL